MEAAKKNLRQTGFLIILVAVFDALIFGLMVFKPELYSQGEVLLATMQASGIQIETMKILVFVFLLLISACVALVGLKAIVVAKGGKESKGINILAIGLAVFFALITLYSISTIFLNGVGVLESNLFIPLLSVIALASFITGQKKLKEAKER